MKEPVASLGLLVRSATAAWNPTLGSKPRDRATAAGGTLLSGSSDKYFEVNMRYVVGLLMMAVLLGCGVGDPAEDFSDSMISKAKAGSDYSIAYAGFEINCATLMGSEEARPGGLTCGFLNEVQQYYRGERTICDPKAATTSLAAIADAGDHLQFHGQSGVLAYASVVGSMAKAAAGNLEWREEMIAIDPAKAADYYSIFLALEQIKKELSSGKSAVEAVEETARSFAERNAVFPNPHRSESPIKAMLVMNPIMSAYAVCGANYPEPGWAQAAPK
ncbi:MAG: hypothetical protein AAGM22_28440 [Acidobacteriota bacterium]